VERERERVYFGRQAESEQVRALCPKEAAAQGDHVRGGREGGRGGGEGWGIILTRVGCVYKTHIDADRHIEAQVDERTGNVIDKGDWMTEFVSS